MNGKQEYSNNNNVDDSCNDTTARCDMSCTTSIDYLSGDESDDEDVVQRTIAKALFDYFELVDDVTSWYDPQLITVKIDYSAAANTGTSPPSTAMAGTPTTTAKVQDAKTDTSPNLKQSSMKAGPFIGVATGILAVLLMVLFLVVRRRRQQQDDNDADDDDSIFHMKLDEDDNTAGIDTSFVSVGDNNSIQDQSSRHDAAAARDDIIDLQYVEYTHQQQRSLVDNDYSRGSDDFHKSARTRQAGTGRSVSMSGAVTPLAVYEGNDKKSGGRRRQHQSSSPFCGVSPAFLDYINSDDDEPTTSVLPRARRRTIPNILNDDDVHYPNLRKNVVGERELPSRDLPPRHPVPLAIQTLPRTTSKSTRKYPIIQDTLNL